jgi:hypothetical protein
MASFSSYTEAAMFKENVEAVEIIATYGMTLPTVLETKSKTSTIYPNAVAISPPAILKS